MSQTVTRHPINPVWMMPSTGWRDHHSAIQSGTSMRNEMPMHQSQRRSSQRGMGMGALIVALFALCGSAFAQGTLSPTPQLTFLDASGNAISNGKLCWYAAGTTTLQNTYFNPDLDISHVNANPVRTNSAGRPTTGGIYLSATSYKLVVLTAGTDGTCSTGTTIYTQDGITAVPATNSALDVTGTAGEALAAGDVVYLSDGSGALTAGRWYKADADLTYASSTAATIGIATAATASAASGSIRVGGRMTGLSGLTAGDLYYVSATAGALVTTPPTNAWFVGKADTTTSLIIGQNQGGVRLPDSDGTHSLVVRTSTNLTADHTLTQVVPDADVTVAVPPSLGVAEGRCTLTTGVPVTTSDVTAATTVYYTPYQGNRIALYDGSAAWNVRTFAQLSIAIPAVSLQMYDVWVYDNAGTPALEVLAWASDTTRATALVLQEGVYVKTGATTRRYVCSFRTTGSSGQTEDSLVKRYVWNYYNRVLRPMRVLEPANTWAYTNTTIRQANANAGNQLDFVIGVSEDMVEGTARAAAQNTTIAQLAYPGIGLDSTTVYATGATMSEMESFVANTNTTGIAHWIGYPGVGRHILTWLESNDAGGAWTYLGDANVPLVRQYGIDGSVWN